MYNQNSNWPQCGVPMQCNSRNTSPCPFNKPLAHLDWPSGLHHCPLRDCDLFMNSNCPLNQIFDQVDNWYAMRGMGKPIQYGHHFNYRGNRQMGCSMINNPYMMSSSYDPHIIYHTMMGNMNQNRMNQCSLNCSLQNPCFVANCPWIMRNQGNMGRNNIMGNIPTGGMMGCGNMMGYRNIGYGTNMMGCGNMAHMMGSSRIFTDNCCGKCCCTKGKCISKKSKQSESCSGEQCCGKCCCLTGTCATTKIKKIKKHKVVYVPRKCSLKKTSEDGKTNLNLKLGDDCTIQMACKVNESECKLEKSIKKEEINVYKISCGENTILKIKCKGICDIEGIEKEATSKSTTQGGESQIDYSKGTEQEEHKRKKSSSSWMIIKKINDEGLACLKIRSGTDSRIKIISKRDCNIIKCNEEKGSCTIAFGDECKIKIKCDGGCIIKDRSKETKDNEEECRINKKQKIIQSPCNIKYNQMMRMGQNIKGYGDINYHTCSMINRNVLGYNTYPLSSMMMGCGRTNCPTCCYMMNQPCSTMGCGKKNCPTCCYMVNLPRTIGCGKINCPTCCYMINLACSTIGCGKINCPTCCFIFSQPCSTIGCAQINCPTCSSTIQLSIISKGVSTLSKTGLKHEYYKKTNLKDQSNEKSPKPHGSHHGKHHGKHHPHCKNFHIFILNFKLNVRQ